MNSIAYPSYAAYYFTNTLPGPWQVVITSDRNDGVVIPFAAYAVMEANRRLSVVKDAALHQAGGTAIITATLLTGEQALDGAGIVAVVERPDAITETLQFESLGSGEYVARFQLPNVGGYYTVAVRARGSDQGQEFTREVNFLLAVSTADAQFTGAAQDSASDENNDGVLDSLQVDIGINVLKPGTYAVSAQLRGMDALIANTTVMTSFASTGVYTVQLSFDGEAIRGSGYYGPFEVRNAQIANVDIGDLPTDGVGLLHTTAAYPGFVTSLLVPIEALTIMGPIEGVLGGDYSFVATVMPLTTTRPITYIWTVTDQLPLTVTQTAGLSNTQVFSWTSTGIKLVTVTSINSVSSISSTYQLSIVEPQPILEPILALSLTAPVSSAVNSGVAFKVEAQPITATQPITYLWNASEQVGLIETTGITSSATFTWTIAGQKYITVTATNATSAVTATTTITIEAPPPPVEPPMGVQLTGPITGLTDLANSFEAAVSPISTTMPITYVWQATDLAPITQTNGLTDAVVLTWGSPGPKTVVVTAINEAGYAAAAHEIVVSVPPPPPVPLASVAVVGPQLGVVGVSYPFTATAEPLTATLPITYQWQATDYETIAHVSGITDRIDFAWTTPGEKQVVVTATNAAGTAVGSVAISSSCRHRPLWRPPRFRLQVQQVLTLTARRLSRRLCSPSILHSQSHISGRQPTCLPSRPTLG